MESLGFPSNWIMRPIIILLAFAIAFYFGAALILQFWKVEWSISRAQKTDVDQSAGKEKLTARSLEEVRTVDITLHNYSLDVQKRNLFFTKAAKLSILKPINTRFEPGLLNVIMGPSGVNFPFLLLYLIEVLIGIRAAKHRYSISWRGVSTIPSQLSTERMGRCSLMAPFLQRTSFVPPVRMYARMTMLSFHTLL